MHTKKIIIYIGISVLVGMASIFFHERSHWLVTELFGYETTFTLNTSQVIDQTIQLSRIERLLTAFAEPLFTIFQAVVFYLILNERKRILLYSFLFYPFTLRFGAAIANVFQPNDEGRISLDLGLPLNTISIVVVGFLFVLIVRISKKYNYSFLFNFLTFLLMASIVILISYLDAKFYLRIV